MRKLWWTLFLWTLLGCGGENLALSSQESNVRARIEVRTSSDGQVTVSATPFDARFSLNFDQATIPAIRNQMLYFGKVAIAELSDTNLFSCNGRRCTRAYIRMYTTGAPGAGAWNQVGGYGMPIYTNRTGEAMKTVGLNVAGAAIVQTYTIPVTKLAISLNDFPGAAYEMRADFTEAGAGTYATTLVVEYGLE